MGDHRVIDLSLPRLTDLPDPAARRPLCAGVAVSLSRRFRVPVLAVRAAFVATTFAAGAGLAIYVALWLLVTRPAALRGEDTPVGRFDPTDSGASGASGASPTERSASGLDRRALGVACFALALITFVVGLGLLDASIAWAVSLVCCGVVLSWDGRPGRAEIGRQVMGTTLVVAGLLIVIGGRLSWSLLVDGAVVGAVVLVGCALVLGPWMIRTSDAAISDRRERVRSEEREAVAAHLHDSVLQTLTLIQRRAAEPDGDPRVVGALARRQERELRRWLYGHGESWLPGVQLKDALESTVADVEDLHGISIELVTVGDTELTMRTRALVAATREAIVNAAKFSGSTSVSVYAEVAGRSTSVYVRDRGAGFDPTAIPTDRRGIRDSIVARMTAAGGRATVRSSPGQGTEIELHLGDSRSDSPPPLNHPAPAGTRTQPTSQTRRGPTP